MSQHPPTQQTDEAKPQTDAITGAIVPTFFRYLIPSLIGLVAMTSASLVDGFFIGNYVGIKALAAVNLIIPITTLLFGVGMMLSVGGSVRGGKYLGENNIDAASAIFSKTLTSLTIYGGLVISLGLIFEQEIFSALGATQSLFPIMSEYYRIIMPFLFAQFSMVALYFFIRLDGLPNLAAAALAIGAAINVILDYLFIAVYEWGLTGAAFATGISQTIPLLVMLSYFWWPKRRMKFSIWQERWREVFHAAYNGISEFINEVSGGIIAFIFNWMMIQRGGVEGVAAITVVNYLLMFGFMVFYSISDTISVMVSQNFGAGLESRIRGFLKTASVLIALLSAIFITILLAFSEPLILIFVETENSDEMVALAKYFVQYVWPLFLFVGANMLITGYLTAIHLPFQSGVVSLCRGLILPAGFLVTLYWLLTDFRFVSALAIAEALTFVIALIIFVQHTPKRTIQEQDAHP